MGLPLINSALTGDNKLASEIGLSGLETRHPARQLLLLCD